MAEWQRRRRNVPARAGSQLRIPAERRTADAGAPGHRGGRVARGHGLPVRRRQGCAGFPPDQRQHAQDVGRGARQRRSRPRPPHPCRSPHQDRSEHGHDRDHANSRPDGGILPADRVLGIARARRPRAAADGVGTLQRVVISRRAAHQGDRRADGARRLVPEGDAVDVGANHAPRHLRAAGRRRIRHRSRHDPDRHACRGDHFGDRARHRSGRVCRKSARGRGCLPAGGLDPRDTCRPRRPDADAATGIKSYTREARQRRVLHCAWRRGRAALPAPPRERLNQPGRDVDIEIVG